LKHLADRLQYCQMAAIMAISRIEVVSLYFEQITFQKHNLF
jgi:hypothetical protein